jgi:hypothetical protein
LRSSQIQDLNKIETIAVLSAIRSVMMGAPSVLADDHPLKVAEQKLQDHLDWLKSGEIDG